MTKINRELENHLSINNLIKDNQIGFTQGGRLEYNHFIVQYLVEKAFIDKSRGGAANFGQWGYFGQLGKFKQSLIFQNILKFRQ